MRWLAAQGRLSAMRGGWVYIMKNAPHGALYIGVTADLARRIHDHRHGHGSAFCRRYGLTRLVHVEPFPTIEEAIAREKAMKAWRRAWKTALISKANPGWVDLFDTINA